VDLKIRPVAEDELDEYVSVLELAVGRRMTGGALTEARDYYELERTLAAFESGRLVGGLASNALELTVPGNMALPAARITLTGVLPTHRRRGISTELNRRQLRWLRDRGEPLAVFTTTGPGFYRRLGYSPATQAAEVEIATAPRLLETKMAQPDAVRVVDEEERDRLLPEIFERHRRRQPGQISRTASFWHAWFQDFDLYRKGEPGDRFAAVADETEGYLTYRLRPGDPREQPVSTLVIEDLVAVTDEARASLWAFCLEFAQAPKVVAHNLPVDEPLTWMLAEPRLLRFTKLREFIWLRLVDLQAALNARAYGARGSLALEVADSTLPENAGRFLLETDGDAASCTRGEEEPELELDIADLAAVYLGGATFATLARAGRVRETSPRAVARADALFASRPAPWTVSDW
jgi:predicted acetyltransferase